MCNSVVGQLGTSLVRSACVTLSLEIIKKIEPSESGFEFYGLVSDYWLISVCYPTENDQLYIYCACDIRSMV